MEQEMATLFTARLMLTVTAPIATSAENVTLLTPLLIVMTFRLFLKRGTIG